MEVTPCAGSDIGTGFLVGNRLVADQPRPGVAEAIERA
jgi:hypothetical protein